MDLNLQLPENPLLKPRITVFGVGGAGGNAVCNMISSGLEGVDFVIANTDAQAMQHNLAANRVQLGEKLTRGLGAGASPDIGAAAAEEAMNEIQGYLESSNMVFITAGMGGGTGTGAAPVIARLAREKGILTVGVVTKPFFFEGSNRMRLAERGISELQKYVDTLIIIPNQNLFRVANEHTTFADAFKMADSVLHAGVRGVTDLMVMPGLINLDFADIKAVMLEMGKAMMGTGEAEGEGRAIMAAEAAISNPLLDNVSMKGARGVLINITGGMDMTLFEVSAAADRIREEVDPDANIIFGSTFDPELNGRLRVSVVATGIDQAALVQQQKQAGEAANASPRSGFAAFQKPPASVAQPASDPTPQSFDVVRDQVQKVLDGLSQPSLSQANSNAYEADQVELSFEDSFMAPEPVKPGYQTSSSYGEPLLEEVVIGGVTTITTAAKASSKPLDTSSGDRYRPSEETHVHHIPPQAKKPGILASMFGFGGNQQPQFSRQEPTSAAPRAQREQVKDFVHAEIEDDVNDLDIPTFLRRKKTDE